MKKSGLVILGIVAFILLAGIALASRNRQSIPDTPFPSQVQNVSSSPSTQPTDTTPTPQSQQPSPSRSPMKEANITITSPMNGATVSRKFTISGQARVFENVLQVRVTNKKTNTVLMTQKVMSDAPDTGLFGPYSYAVTLPQTVQSGDQLIVEAFQYSAKDGSEIDNTTVVVTFN